MREKRIRSGVIVIVLAATAVGVFLTSCAQKADPLETVRIGAGTGFASGLVYVADDKGFFRSRGVAVTINAFETGPMAVDALVDDKVDLATAAEFVMVRKSFDNNHFRTFAQIANMNPIEIIARKDRGIEKTSDLKGKKIGLTLGSSSEFYLDRFLKSSNIANSSVEMVNLGPNAIEDSFYSGRVDAVVSWGLQVTAIKDRLRENAISWPVQGRDDYCFLMITTDRFLHKSVGTAEKIVRALIDAEQFAVKQPEEARRIIEARVSPLPRNVPPDWSKFRLEVRLDQALITLMEAEAAWMIRNNLTTEKKVPNYFKMIDLKPLKAVKPDAIGVIH